MYRVSFGRRIDGVERRKAARDCLEGVATDYLTDNQLYVPVGKADAVYIGQIRGSFSVNLGSEGLENVLGRIR